jgi:hypothetical protein
VSGDVSLVPTDRRQGVRFGNTIPALIHVADGVPLHHCTVLDVSHGGGRIRLDTGVTVPDRFTLLLTRSGTVRRACRVIWRHHDYLGVAFSAQFDHA